MSPRGDKCRGPPVYLRRVLPDEAEERRYFDPARRELDAALEAFREEWPTLRLPLCDGFVLHPRDVRAWQRLCGRNEIAADAMTSAVRELVQHVDRPEFFDAMCRLARLALEARAIRVHKSAILGGLYTTRRERQESDTKKPY